MPRTVLVTGANRGLGRAAAERLARGGHRLVLAGRSAAALEETRSALEALAPGCVRATVALDLASFGSVREAATRLLTRGEPLDGLLNNAGVMQQSPTRRETADGLEETLQTNALGPLLLTRLLLPLLAEGRRARVVNVSSRLHFPGSRGVSVDFDLDDPQLTRGYHPERAYKNSKLALQWWTHELAARLRRGGPYGDVTCNAVCPGFVPETAAHSVHGFQRFFLAKVLVHAPFATSVADATQALCELLVEPRFEGVQGAFFADHREQPPSADARDGTKARAFWALACALTGLPEEL